MKSKYLDKILKAMNKSLFHQDKMNIYIAKAMDFFDALVHEDESFIKKHKKAKKKK